MSVEGSDVIAPSNELAAEDDADEALFRFYVGYNADRFIPVYRARMQGRLGIHLNWAVFFFGFPWFFYRKMYLVGLAFLALAAGAYFLSPDMPEILFFLFWPLAAVFADSLYVAQAQKAITRVKAMALSDRAREERLVRLGGASLRGLFFGLFLYAGLVIYSIV